MLRELLAGRVGLAELLASCGVTTGQVLHLERGWGGLITSITFLEHWPKVKSVQSSARARGSSSSTSIVEMSSK